MLAHKQSDKQAYRWHSECWHTSNQMNKHTDGTVNAGTQAIRWHSECWHTSNQMNMHTDGTVNAGTQAIRRTCKQMVEWTYSQVSSGAHTTRGLSSQTNRTHIISCITTLSIPTLCHILYTAQGCSSIIDTEHIQLRASQHIFGMGVGGRCCNVILSVSLTIKIQMAVHSINDKLERIWKGLQSTSGITKPGSWTDREET